MGREQTLTAAAFGAIGGSSALLGAIECGIAVAHVRGGAARGAELFAAFSGLVLLAIGIGFVYQAIRIGLRRPHAG